MWDLLGKNDERTFAGARASDKIAPMNEPARSSAGRRTRQRRKTCACSNCIRHRAACSRRGSTRLPPPRYTLYRCLRLSDRRTRRPSPLSTSFLRAALAICDSPGLPTQRRRRSGPSGTSPTHRDGAQTPHRRTRQDLAEMPLLQCVDPQDVENSRLLTQ